MLDQLTPLALLGTMVLQQSGATAVDQISRDVPIVHVAAGSKTSEAPAQLSGKEQSRTGSPQLVSGPKSAASGEQLAPPKPNAQPPAPLSSRSEGRPTPAERLAGSDRCDPQEGASSREAKCDQVIEKRAAAFKGSDAPQLSPEQKILLEQSELERSYEAAARRLATTGDDAESLESQGVAFVVLQPPAPDDKEKPEDKPSEAEAAAIAGAILNSGPQQ